MDWPALNCKQRAFPRTKLRRRSFAASLCALVAGLVVALPPVVFAQSDENGSLEYRVKAAFLFNFAKFVNWPTNALAAEDTPMVIGVMADDPAAPILQQVLSDKTVDNKRRLSVRLLTNVAEIDGVHMVFLGRSQKEKYKEILEHLKASPVLTVGETDQFTQQGGIMNFVRKEESFRFEVNLDAAERVGLKISGKLASMAIIVSPRK